MAYQPKSYRKFLATSVAAAMVATVAAPLAGAAGNFNDVAAGAYYTDAVDYLVDRGVVDGFPDGTFQPNTGVTRAQASVMLVAALGLEVPETVELAFTDTKDDVWYSGSVAALVNAGIVEGNPDGTFAPGATITRAALAKMVVEAYELTADASQSVSFTDTVNGAWYEGYVTTLASLGIVQGTSTTTFAPNATVTRAQASVFLHRTEVPTVRVSPESGQVELQIVGVSALTNDGHVLAVEFNRAPGSVTKGDVSVYNSKDLTRSGVDTVEVYGNTVEITLYDVENSTEINYLTPYTVKVAGVEYEFVRPGYLDGDDNAVVTDIDTKDNKITLANSAVGNISANITLEVPADLEFDYEEVFGQEIRVWFDGDENIIRYELEGNTVVYDAIELTETFNAVTEAGELELDQAGDKYDIADDVTLFVNGLEVAAGNMAAALTDGVTYDYAKIVLNSSGDVQFINAVNWDGSVIVEKVDGDLAVGYDENLDLEEYVIVKDGKQISVEDIEAGDIIFYNESADNSLAKDGYAEVYSNGITGKITAAFDNGFELDGKVYDYDAALSLDEDGDIQDFRFDEADENIDEEVTVCLDRNGDVVFVAGELTEATNSTEAVYLLDDILGYKQAARDYIELEYKNAAGEKEVSTVRLEDLEEFTYNNVEYDVDDTPNAAAGEVKVALANNETELAITGAITQSITLDGDNTDNTVVNITKDDNGNVVGLEIFTGVQSAGLAALATIEAGDSYVNTASGNKKLSDDVVVYDITRDNTNPGASNVVPMTFGELAGNEITAATVYFDDEDRVVAIIASSDTAEDTTDQQVVLTDVRYNDETEVVRITAYVGNEEKTFTVDEQAGTFNDGDVVTIDVNDATGVVDSITALPGTFFAAGKTVQGVDLNDLEIFTNQGDVYELVDGYTVYDVTDPTDVTTESLRDARDIDPNTQSLTVIYDEDGASRFVQAVLITNTVDNTLPTASGYNLALNNTDEETITITVSESLNLADSAAVTGFTTSTGTVASAVYDANTNTIVLTSANDAEFTAATTITYTQTGNVEDAAGNELAAFAGQAVQ